MTQQPPQNRQHPLQTQQEHWPQAATGHAGSHPVQVVVNQTQTHSNGVGTTGFVFALIGLFFFWVPILGWFIWFLGALLSFIGVFRKPRGLALAGLVISFIDLILLVLALAGLGALLGGMS